MPKRFSLSRRNFLKLGRLFAEEQGTCLLYSGGNFDSAVHSFLFLFPYECIHISEREQKKVTSNKTIFLSPTSNPCINPWDALEKLISPFDKSSSIPKWVGFIGYEMGAFSDPEKQLPSHTSQIPYAYFQSCTIILKVEHATDLGTLFINEEGLPSLDANQQKWMEKLLDNNFWEELESLNVMDIPTPVSPYAWSSSDTRDSYIQKIQHAKELINAGEIYQINLSQEFRILGQISAYPLFESLVNLNPAPFSAYLRLSEFAVVSSSPERLLKKENGLLETRPIKGTAPRGKSEEEDRLNREQLINSPKEKAELLMITDLMRNDIGKVSLPGTVETSRLWHCEKYANVFHLLSIIRSQAKPHLHPIKILRSCFPGGSITGCPKLRAMEIIDHVENRARGLYTGSIGYFAENGDFDFNIAIRTMIVFDSFLSIQLGGGIVADSDPCNEYQETLYKGESIFKALGLGNRQQ